MRSFFYYKPPASFKYPRKSIPAKKQSGPVPSSTGPELMLNQGSKQYRQLLWSRPEDLFKPVSCYNSIILEVNPLAARSLTLIKVGIRRYHNMKRSSSFGRQIRYLSLRQCNTVNTELINQTGPVASRSMTTLAYLNVVLGVYYAGRAANLNSISVPAYRCAVIRAGKVMPFLVKRHYVILPAINMDTIEVLTASTLYVEAVVGQVCELK